LESGSQLGVTERRVVRPGKPYPLGAHWDGSGTNFALLSAHATAVTLCLFDTASGREERIPLPSRTGHVWHGYVPGVGPGQRYGFRVDGPYDPNAGHRFNPHKLVLDPYARAVDGTVDWQGPVWGYRRDWELNDLEMDEADDAAFVPKGVVIDPRFEWEDDQRPEIPWSRTIIYEAHVKGMTARHPEVPPELRGTYAGLAHPAIIEHLRQLGVTTIELMPVHAFVDDDFLVERGLRNYWGYSPLAYFAPEGRYASRGTGGEQVAEFKAMVKALHAAGFEVLLDVVYNHTCEGNHLGPTLSFRGIDNRTYYRLFPEHARFYQDLTGTGNTIAAYLPPVLRLIADSLRYWVEEMHVDGFRFDLAPVLGRDPNDFDPYAAFFDIVYQDPVLARVKLIAEPWDLGHSGYQVGNFPVGWAEWNDRFRDAARAFWLGHRRDVGELALRLSGSPDLFGRGWRGPQASINHVTAHDGFTLEDLVSYNCKHNEANGEENRDGSDHNLSFNHGVEGPTDDPAILAIRDRQKRNLLATLLLSRGVPMICHGDEIGRTQRGNNNAYCQDNEISWLDWDLDERATSLLEFTRRLIAVRTRYPALSLGVADGNPAHGHGESGMRWFRPDGHEMTSDDWAHPTRLAIMMSVFATSEALDERDGPTPGEVLLLLINGEAHHQDFHLPAHDAREDRWEVLLETSSLGGVEPPARVAAGGMVTLADRSLALYRAAAGPRAEQSNSESERGN